MIMNRRDTTTLRPVGSSSIDAIKLELASRIIAALDRQGLTVREAHARTGQAAADFSRIRGGDLGRFSVERLIATCEALGDPIALSLSPLPQPPRNSLPAPLTEHIKAIRRLCRRYSVQRLAAFGSVLRDDFDPARSDIDLAVEFGRSRRYGPADQYFSFKAAIEKVLGRSVDLVELRVMPESRLKRTIKRDQVPIFEEAA